MVVRRVRFLLQLIGHTGVTARSGEDTVRKFCRVTFRHATHDEESSQSWQKTTASFEFIRTQGFSDQLKLQPNYSRIPFKVDARMYARLQVYTALMKRGTELGPFRNDLSAAQTPPRILWIRPETRLDWRNIRSDELSKSFAWNALRYNSIRRNDTKLRVLMNIELYLFSVTLCTTLR